jgi:phosphatidylserine/phosphatidylglycerophosphate/cardiolipin synthase-like enzyme
LGIAAVLAACSTAQLKQSPAGLGNGPVEGDCAGDEDCAPSDPSVDGGRIPTVEGGAFAVSHDVTIQVQPSDEGAAIVAAIRGAKKSVHMTMYLLNDDGLGADVIAALGDRKQAGKDVKVVLNQAFPTNGDDNGPAYDALASRGVPVQWAPARYTFTHAKTIIVDGEKVVIMTMNLTYTSATTNREYIATDADPADVADAEEIFAADFAGESVSVKSKLVVSPKGANTLDPREHLEALVGAAKASLDVEVQSLSDSGIVDAIIRAHRANVAVRVVIDGDTSDSKAQLAAIAKLKQNGVPLRSLKSPDLHAKAIVVDEAMTFVGSQNMTSTALFENRELGVITDAPAEAAKVRNVIADDFEKGVELP